MKKLIAIVLAAALLIAMMPTAFAADRNRAEGAYNYLRDLAKEGSLAEYDSMKTYTMEYALDNGHVAFDLSFDAIADKVSFVLDASSFMTGYRNVSTLSLPKGYWNTAQGSVNGHHWHQDAGTQAGAGDGTYSFLPKQFTGTSGFRFNEGYTGDPAGEQQNLKEALQCMNDILTLVDDLLKQGGYQIQDLGFSGYPGHLTHSYGQYVETTQPSCASDGSETRYCYICNEKNLQVIPALGHEWELTKKLSEGTQDAHGVGSYTCTRCAQTKEAPLCACELFTDAPKEGNWAHDGVDWAVFSGISNGTSATTFCPEASCTRAQIVTFLWRAEGSPEPKITETSFTDISSDQFYYKAVLWAVENEITTGTSATTFSPERDCTRAQAVTFLWRAAGKPAPQSTENRFEDVQPDYYTDAVLWAVENEITNGVSDTTFAPDTICSRAQIVTFLYRAARCETAEQR